MLVKTLHDSPSKPEMFCFPGSEGMGDLAQRVDVSGLDELIEWMKKAKALAEAGSGVGTGVVHGEVAVAGSSDAEPVVANPGCTEFVGSDFARRSRCAICRVAR